MKITHIQAQQILKYSKQIALHFAKKYALFGKKDGSYIDDMVAAAALYCVNSVGKFDPARGTWDKWLNVRATSGVHSYMSTKGKIVHKRKGTPLVCPLSVLPEETVAVSIPFNVSLLKQILSKASLTESQANLLRGLLKGDSLADIARLKGVTNAAVEDQYRRTIKQIRKQIGLQ